MVYDREGRKLWIVEDTGRHTPVEAWDEISRRPRGPGLPDWWVVARDIGWRPLAQELFTDDAGYTGTSLLSMHPADVDRALAAAPAPGGPGPAAGGTGTTLGCGGACQEAYDTSTGRYAGGAGGSGGTSGGKGTGGGSTGGKGGGARTPAPQAPPAGDSSQKPTATTYHKAAGADRTPPPPKWPESDPPTPPGVDLEKNIREAEAHKLDALWFKEQVNSRRPWDYKNNEETKGSERVEDFGNFNYGATGAALGLPLDMLQWFAGDKQLEDHPNDPKQATSRWRYPYGDDPRDAEMIRRGYEYYQRWKRLPTKE